MYFSARYSTACQSRDMPLLTDATLSQASEQGILDNKVVALGGVTPDKIHYLKSLNFGGAAMLGCINSMAGLSEAQLCVRLHSIRECFG